MTFFTSYARKAQLAALIAALAPILTYVTATGEWSWRALAGAVVSGVIAGVTVFNTQNAPLPPVPRAQARRHRQENGPQ